MSDAVEPALEDGGKAEPPVGKDEDERFRALEPGHMLLDAGEVAADIEIAAARRCRQRGIELRIVESTRSIWWPTRASVSTTLGGTIPCLGRQRQEPNEILGRRIGR
jgi:hypothetical protein